MSFLDKVKAVFVVPENATEKQTPSVPQPRSNPTEPEINVAGEPSDLSKFWTALSEALEKNNEPGFDYLEFRKALLSIKKLGNLDEAAQYKTAFAAAEAMGVDAQKLTDTAKHYLQVLKQESDHFSQTAKDFQEKQNAQLEQEMVQLQQLIQDKLSTIEKLQKEVDEHKKKLNVAQNAASEVNQKVEVNKRGFATVYQQLVDQIQSDIRNMDAYLDK